MTDPTHLPLVPGSILVGTDYSAESMNAANQALALARALSARVHLLHAWVAPHANVAPVAGGTGEPAPQLEHPNLLTLMRREAENQMTEFSAALDTTGVTVTTGVESGDPRSVLVHYAENHACDWVVVGTRSLSAVAEWFLGNVATHVVRHCQVPVLVVPSKTAP
jgi:nucleotide-binding universal stress UspA family protein